MQYLCLCYHEARNVRHLVKAGYVPPQLFERLRLLPTNKIEAWHALRRSSPTPGGFPRSPSCGALLGAVEHVATRAVGNAKV